MSILHTPVRRRASLGPLVAMALVVGSCRSPVPTQPTSPNEIVRRPVAARQPHPPHTVALLINGGGQRQINFQSHLHHVQAMVDVLRNNGIAPEDITVFSSDGDDPAADLAARARMENPDFWLLPQLSVGRLLSPPVTYVDSSVDGVALRPARKEGLGDWFATNGQQLAPGDTLLLYVTDHGDKNPKDLTDNTILLWNKETLSVSELRQLLATLDPQVRVVMLMSQCFSGSFANAIFADPAAGLPGGNVCGYFSAPADRYAYGCYPENRDKDGIGHSHTFIDALAVLHSFPEAERRTLMSDDTPDVPHSTVDFFLARQLQQAAGAAGRDYTSTVDDLLAEAWRDRGAWEPDIRLLDRIGHTFGFFSPRSLAELQQQANVLPEISKRLDTYAARWSEGLEALRLENLERFLDAHPAWRERLQLEALKQLGADARRATATELLAELATFTRASKSRYKRLLSLRRRADDAETASYRMEVRLGVVLRMRSILASIAGRVYMASHAGADERAAFERLASCEQLALSQPVPAVAALPTPHAFPSLADDRRLVEAVMPSWMGIRYQPLTDAERSTLKAEKGAVTVMTVYPDSPAASAGLTVGDVILGPPQAPFLEPHQLREWTMYSEIGALTKLQILRNGKPLRIAFRPGPFPMEMPKLPGPPEIGSPAPPLKLDLFSGETQLSAAKPRLLFFWATWCLVCKSALPELMAFEKDRGIEVVAITDEPAETLQKFFGEFHDPFPSIVAIDRYRSTFQSYGVSGTPTFVLLNADGTVATYKTGYNPRIGIGVEGWEWKGRAVSGQ